VAPLHSNVGMHESGIGSKKRVEVGELRARRQEVRVVRARSLDSLEKARVFGMTPVRKALGAAGRLAFYKFGDCWLEQRGFRNFRFLATLGMTSVGNG
jgi:hypothetical protein